MNNFFSRKLSLVLTLSLMVFLAVVYSLKPTHVVRFQPTARLANAPVFKVVSDPDVLNDPSLPHGPAYAVIPDSNHSRTRVAMDTPNTPENSAVMSDAPSSGLGINIHEAQDTRGITPPASNSAEHVNSDAAVEFRPAFRAEVPAGLEEFKDMGMALIAGNSREWYTVQTAFVSIDDHVLLNRRLIELSSALGTRDDIYIYQVIRNGKTYHGLFARRLPTVAKAKDFQRVLEKKLGYQTQVRSHKGLRTEQGF